MKKVYVLLIILVITAASLYGVLIHPVKVDLVLLAEIYSAEGNIPIIVGPVFWTQHRDSSHGTLGYDDEVVAFLNNYDFSGGYLIISWGRPLHSLTYGRWEVLLNELLNWGPMALATPVFGSPETPTTLYIYNTTNAQNIWLDDFFTKNLYYPEIKIVE